MSDRFAMLAALLVACSGPAAQPVGPVGGQSPVDAAPLPVEEPDPADEDHVLPREPKPRGRVVVTTSDSCGLVIQPVYFAQNSATPISNDAVDGIADMLIYEYKESGLLLKIAVQGHADPSETDADDLSLRRAQTVATMLTARRMPTLGPFAIEPMGVFQPWDKTGSAEGRARNRRVDFMILERKTKGD